MLFNYFSIRARLLIRKLLYFGSTVDRPVGSTKSCSSYYPLLYHDYQPVPGIRRRDIDLLISLNRALKFENTEYKETCLLDLSGKRWGKYRMLSIHPNKRERIYRPCPIFYSQPPPYFLTHFRNIT